MFKDKILLVSGGTGSFGNAVIRRFLNSDIGEIRVFSRDEKKQDDARKRYNSNRLKFYIGDVRDSASVIKSLIEKLRSNVTVIVISHQSDFITDYDFRLKFSGGSLQ